MGVAAHCLVLAACFGLASGASRVVGRGGADYENPEAVAEAARAKYWNWADKGVVTPVMTQGQCAAGYAFFTADSMASQAAIAGHPLVALSVQESLDCVPRVNGYGCLGGLPDHAFDWILNKSETGGGGGLTTDKNYPYTAAPQHKCNRTKVGQIHTHLEGYTRMVNTTEEKMMSWIYHNGPLVVAMRGLPWELGYIGGVVKGCNGDHRPDKIFMFTGYNDAHNPPYWIIKDNFGQSYGENGYVWMIKGKDACGLTSYVSAANPMKPIRPDALGV